MKKIIQEKIKNHILNLIAEEQEEQQKPEDTEAQIDVPEPTEMEDDAGEADSLYTPDTLIKLFNTIRSGQSMKKKIVINSIKEWWDTNEENELKQFLFMLANIAKIVSSRQEDEEDTETESSDGEIDDKDLDNLSQETQTEEQPKQDATAQQPKKMKIEAV